MTTFAMPDPSPIVGALLRLAASRRGTVELTADRLNVRLGHTWHTSIPRSFITGAERVERRTPTAGAHGHHGRWLVNTTTSGLVRLTLDPPATGHLLALGHTLTELTVSLAEPDAFLQALGVSNVA